MEEVSPGSSDEGRESITIDEVICRLLHEYPFTNISHFTSSYKDGGLSEPQVETLYVEALRRQDRQNVILASFHGIKISDIDDTSGLSSVKESELPPGISNPKTFVFGDPESYNGMTEEQKTQLTQEMINNHQNWVKNQGTKLTS